MTAQHRAKHPRQRDAGEGEEKVSEVEKLVAEHAKVVREFVRHCDDTGDPVGGCVVCDGLFSRLIEGSRKLECAIAADAAAAPQPGADADVQVPACVMKDFKDAVTWMQQRYPEWDGTANGKTITLTGCANLLSEYVREYAAQPGVSQEEYDSLLHQWNALCDESHANYVKSTLPALESRLREVIAKWRKLSNCAYVAREFVKCDMYKECSAELESLLPTREAGSEQPEWEKHVPYLNGRRLACRSCGEYNGDWLAHIRAASTGARAKGRK